MPRARAADARISRSSGAAVQATAARSPAAASRGGRREAKADGGGKAHASRRRGRCRASVGADAVAERVAGGQHADRPPAPRQDARIRRVEGARPGHAPRRASGAASARWRAPPTTTLGRRRWRGARRPRARRGRPRRCRRSSARRRRRGARQASRYRTTRRPCASSSWAAPRRRARWPGASPDGPAIAPCCRSPAAPAEPAAAALPIAVGGFGGADGPRALSARAAHRRAWSTRRIRSPRGCRANAVAAARQRGVPLLRPERPPWRRAGRRSLDAGRRHGAGRRGARRARRAACS